jgi:RNA polymerase sigma-70 factor (ECF subfamily)
LADELFADLWLHVVASLPAFHFRSGDPETVFAGWLYRIARNLAANASRQSSVRTVPLTQSIATREPAPDEQVIAAEERQEVCAALEQLTPEQREVLLLRFVEERSPTEVAVLTGRSVGAVKVMQHRAVRALARMCGVPGDQRRRS